jgi:hypothetical protein
MTTTVGPTHPLTMIRTAIINPVRRVMGLLSIPVTHPLEQQIVPLGNDSNEGHRWEIAENLDRADLNMLERAEHIAEWVRLTEGEKVGGATCASHLDASGRRKSPQQKPSGINAAVRELGIDRTEAQRAVHVPSDAAPSPAATPYCAAIPAADIV